MYFEVSFGPSIAYGAQEIAKIASNFSGMVTNFLKMATNFRKIATLFLKCDYDFQTYRHIRNYYLSNSRTFQDGSGNGNSGKLIQMTFKMVIGNH